MLQRKIPLPPFQISNLLPRTQQSLKCPQTTNLAICAYLRITANAESQNTATKRQPNLKIVDGHGQMVMHSSGILGRLSADAKAGRTKSTPLHHLNLNNGNWTKLVVDLNSSFENYRSNHFGAYFQLIAK